MARVILNPIDRKRDVLLRWMRGKKSSEGITQVELSEKMFTTQPALSRKMRGQTKITYDDLLVIFKELKATDEEILRMMRM